jgi:hypothetical protein
VFGSDVHSPDRCPGPNFGNTIQQGTHCTNISKLSMIRNEPNQVFDAIAGAYIYLIGHRGLHWMEKGREGHEATLGRRE